MSPSFVDRIPEELAEGIVYICIQYDAIAHLCCCGCREEVFTPLSPTDWTLIYDGVHASLEPSIGNWSLACRSHYFIRENKVVWAHVWSETRIQSGRLLDAWRKAEYYKEGSSSEPESWDESIADMTQSHSPAKDSDD